MRNSYLEIYKPGLLTMIQDEGRYGYQHYGIPSSGYMDNLAGRIANLLVDKDPSSPLIEMNLVGPELKVTGDIYIAITGADMQASIDEVKIPMYETVHIKDQSSIKFRNSKDGARTYLAIAGELEVIRWLNSSSAYSNIKIPSLKESVLSKGMKVSINNSTSVAKKLCPQSFRLNNQINSKIRIVKGPEFDWFSSDQIDFFSSTEFTVEQKSNRMAINLEEALPISQTKEELISSGTIAGTIQISNNGKPIILMRECGTTGGYPRVAKIIQSDLNIIAQLRAGQKIKFEFISYDHASKILIEEQEKINTLIRSI